MDWKTGTYLAYLAVSIALTVWVARTLSRNGTVFLVDVFAGREELARSVNQLLVVGFYLVNTGFITLALRTDEPVTGPDSALEVLSHKLGLVLLLVGVLHLGNVLVLNRIRRQRVEDVARPAAAVPPAPAYPAAPPGA